MNNRDIVERELRPLNGLMMLMVLIAGTVVSVGLIVAAAIALETMRGCCRRPRAEATPNVISTHSAPKNAAQSA